MRDKTQYINIRGQHHSMSLLANCSMADQADTRVWCGDGCPVSAPSLLLASSSPFLLRLLQDQDQQQQQDYCLILPDFSSQIVRLFLGSLTTADGWAAWSKEVRHLATLLHLSNRTLDHQLIKEEEEDFEEGKEDMEVVNEDIADRKDYIEIEQHVLDVGIDNGHGCADAVDTVKVKADRTVAVKKKARKKTGSKKRGRPRKTEGAEAKMNCLVCSKGFGRDDALANHLATSHVVEAVGDRVRCLFDSCDLTLSAVSKQLSEQLRQHGLTHSCPVCRRVCSSMEKISLCQSSHFIITEEPSSAAAATAGGDGGRWICTFPSCAFTSSSSSEALDHEKKNHRREVSRKRTAAAGERPSGRRIRPSSMKISCSDCGVLVAKKHMPDHQNLHTGEKPHVCQICGFAAAAYSRLKQHEYGEHRLMYRCEECGTYFKSLQSIRNHRMIHADERPHQCDICGRGFRQLAGMRKHRFTHTGGEPFKCNECNMSYTEHRRLVRHIKMHHTEERPFQCSICSSHFVDSEALRKHEKRHSDERRYKCSLCPQTFKTGCVLKNHERTHTGEKPFRCDHCTRSFAQRGTLRTHLKIHPGASRECPACHRVFIQKSSYLAHLETSGHCSNLINRQETTEVGE